MSDNQPNIFTGNSGGGWGPALGAAGGAIVGEILGLNGNRNNSATATPGVTPDQMQSALSSLETRIQDSNLAAAVGGIKPGVDATVAAAVAALGGQIAGVKDTVVAGQQATALELCKIGHMVTTEGAATRAEIQRVESATIARELAASQARVAELQSAAHHTATQNIIVNAQAQTAAGNGGNCNNQLLQALQLAQALRSNQCCPTGAPSGN